MIQIVPEAESTNSDLAGRVAAGENLSEGFWLVADRQTAGRGRRGRSWAGGIGNFAGSTLVRRRHGDPPMETLALVTGLAVWEAVSSHLARRADAFLKWPNDLMVGSAKLAGILLEGLGDTAIVGIGVNLASAPDVAERETISLSALGRAPDRDVFAQELAAQFRLELERWRSFGMSPVVRRWIAAAHPLGTALSVSGSKDAITGEFAGLDEEGALKLRLMDGSLRTIYAGEIRLTQEKSRDKPCC